MKFILYRVFHTGSKFRKHAIVLKKFGLFSRSIQVRYLSHTNTKTNILLPLHIFNFPSIISSRIQHNWIIKKPKNPTNKNVLSHSVLMDILQNCHSVSDQIKAFDLYVKLDEEDIVQRFNMCKRLENLLKQYFPSCSIHMVGSSACGFGMKGCDLDLSFQFADASTIEKLDYSPLWTNSLDEILDMEIVSLSKVISLTPKNQLLLIQNALQRCGLSEPFTILKGKCPILTFYVDGVPCDLSINNRNAVDSTRLMLLCDKMNPCVAPLVRIVKYWAKQNQLVGGPLKFKSYALFLLVVFFLQTKQPKLLPPLQHIYDKTDFFSPSKNCSEDALKHLQFFEPSENSCTIEQLLEEFFFFYGNFDFTSVICPRTSKLIDRKSFLGKEKPEIELNAISIQDPLKEMWNVTTGVNFKYCKHFLKCIMSVCEKFEDLLNIQTQSELWGLSSVLNVLDLSESVAEVENVRLELHMSSLLQEPIFQENAELTFQKACSILEILFNDCLLFHCNHLDCNQEELINKAQDTEDHMGTSQVSNASLEKHFLKYWHYVASNTWSGRNGWQLQTNEESLIAVEQEISKNMLEDAKTKQKEQISFKCECCGVYKDNDLLITMFFKPINGAKFLFKFRIFLRQYILKMFKLLM